ncbi:MAG: hypothetical protein VX498_07590 [Myxococcota bacterium]|nr:hypothetical protein [Myxococcota bacterium]
MVEAHRSSRKSCKSRLLRLWAPLFFLGFLVAPSQARGGDPEAEAVTPHEAPEVSEPHDPDLKLGSSCRKRPKAKVLVETLPTYLKELVVLWPRSGSRREDGRCVSVARLTIIDHHGVISTLSVELHPTGSSPSYEDYRVENEGDVPRAVFTSQPRPSHPHILVSLAGPVGSARDSLERTLEFVPMDSLVERFGRL